MRDEEVDIVYSHLVIRSFQLLKQCPKEWKNQFQIVVGELYEQMNQWIHMDDQAIKTFIGQLMLGAKRSYEGYDYYYNPMKIFFFRHDPLLNILKSTKIIRKFMNTRPKLQPYFNPIMFKIVKNILKRNRAIISIICQAEVTDQIIDKYFSQTIFIEFTHKSKKLMGLSSYHGGITYIKKNMSFWQTLTTIIHEFAHNISRFLMKKKKVCFISPKKNQQLRYYNIQDQEFKQQEAGNFLEQKLFGIKDNGQGPFGLKQFQI